ncbi:hypothetical protein J6590_046828 [Homalodisca vitripennis]|nr:hypothetical protein J6590_046828 [Homalodisca vitripennis]
MTGHDPAHSPIKCWKRSGSKLVSGPDKEVRVVIRLKHNFWSADIRREEVNVLSLSRRPKRQTFPATVQANLAHSFLFVNKSQLTTLYTSPRICVMREKKRECERGGGIENIGSTRLTVTIPKHSINNVTELLTTQRINARLQNTDWIAGNSRAARAVAKAAHYQHQPSKTKYTCATNVLTSEGARPIVGLWHSTK